MPFLFFNFVVALAGLDFQVSAVCGFSAVFGPGPNTA